MKGSDMHLPETYTFDFAKRRFPYWFRPEDSTRQAAVVSYMHAHQLTLTRVYAKTGCSRHFCNYRFTAYDDPAAIPGPVANCAWIDVGGAEPGCRLPHGFVYRPGRAIPILQSAFDRVPDPSQPIAIPSRAPAFRAAPAPRTIPTASPRRKSCFCSRISPTTVSIPGSIPRVSRRSATTSPNGAAENTSA